MTAPVSPGEGSRTVNSLVIHGRLGHMLLASYTHSYVLTAATVILNLGWAVCKELINWECSCGKVKQTTPPWGGFLSTLGALPSARGRHLPSFCWHLCNISSLNMGGFESSTWHPSFLWSPLQGWFLAIKLQHSLFLFFFDPISFSRVS